MFKIEKENIIIKLCLLNTNKGFHSFIHKITSIMDVWDVMVDIDPLDPSTLF